MAPFKSSKGRNIGKQVKGYKTSTIGQTLGGGGNQFSVTGGMKYQPGNGYIYHIFTGPGQIVTPNPETPVNIPNCAFCMIGGGGGGAGILGPGGAGGGGGGAGGMLYSNDTTLLIGGASPIVVGAGGAIAPPAYSVTATNGADTTWAINPGLTLTSKGGGGGAMYDEDGLAGGSGGGAAFAPSSGGATNQAAANPSDYTSMSFGTAGTDGNPDAGIYNGSGGGGAGGAGDYSPTRGGAGGPAKDTVFNATLFATNAYEGPGMPATWRTAVGSSGKLAQGGAGATYSPNVGKASGYAGEGGGGGSAPAAPASERSGLDNTGSGGGGGAGGSGILILRYPTTVVVTYT